jgi:hypothetical protein
MEFSKEHWKQLDDQFDSLTQKKCKLTLSSVEEKLEMLNQMIEAIRKYRDYLSTKNEKYQGIINHFEASEPDFAQSSNVILPDFDMPLQIEI